MLVAFHELKKLKKQDMQIDQKSFGRPLDFLGWIRTVIFMILIRSIREKPKKSFFKIDIRNQKLKTNTQELGHISFALLRCTLLIFN